ncbi:MAG TPA: hypothetical protein VF789_00940 [Thermoanaerobaculia bacterium]
MVGRREGSRESGYAMITALMVTFLLSVALGLLASSLLLRMNLVKRDAETVILSSLSDAALAEAMANLAESSFYSGAREHDFGGGTIESTVERLGANVFLITAKATYAERTRTVIAEVVRRPGLTAARGWRVLPVSEDVE